MTRRLFARNPYLSYLEGEGSEGSGGTGDAGGSDDGNEGGSGENQKTFTQAELETKIEERLRRERQKFGDYDDLKRKAEEHDKFTESQKTEHEKAIEAARKEAREQATSEVLLDRFSDKVEVCAAKAGFADTEDAVLRLSRRYDEFAPKDGKTFDVDAIEAALKQLLKDSPHLAATQADDKKVVGRVTGGARTSSASEPTTPAARLRQAYAESK